MNGVTIADASCDLKDLLELLGSEAVNSNWTMIDVEATGDSADVLHRLGDSSACVPGDKFLILADDLIQVVDGTFQAFRTNGKRPWIVIRAVDGGAYDVETDSDDVLQAVRQRFSHVQDLP